jgi:hypothetical protein
MGSITGNLDDAWQSTREDVGPAGVDKGKGGKCLILPPRYKDKLPDGYIALPSDSYGGFALLRPILRSGGDADIAKAVAYGKRIKLYPSRRRRIRRRRYSSMRSMWCSTPPSLRPALSSSRSLASCRTSPGSPEMRR